MTNPHIQKAMELARQWVNAETDVAIAGDPSDEFLIELATIAVAKQAALESSLVALVERVRKETIEEMGKDAERYRWLRNTAADWTVMFDEKPKFDGGAWCRIGSRFVRTWLDDRIDRALASPVEKL